MKIRIDKIISKRCSDLSRSDIKNLIENRGVFVFSDGSWKIADDPAKKIEDNIGIRISGKKLAQIKKAREISLEPDSSIKFDVLYKDNDIAIIEKPAGLVVHPSHSHKSGTLVNGLIVRWPQIAGIGEDPARPGIVHRLDKDVSGIMAVAKTQAGFQNLKKQFQFRTAKKTYIALVYGKPPAEKGVIRGAITRSKQEPTKQTISEKGKEAVTEYRVISPLLPKEYSLLWKERREFLLTLLECRPLTGRMHQIRVHLASIGCPVAGDKKYLPKNLLKIDKFSRIMLHAQSLEIELMNGERRRFESKTLSLKGLPKRIKKVQKINKNLL